MSWFEELFINEAKPALNRHSGSSSSGGGDEVLNSVIDRSVTEIKLSDATHIGNHAFNGCSNLTTVECPNVITIGDEAFGGCSNLASINFPKLKTLGYRSIASTKLEELILPDGIEKINRGFETCSPLKRVVIPESVTTVGEGCWKNSQAKTVGPIGSGCDFEFGWKTKLPSGCFDGLKSESIILPEGIEEIGAYCFRGSLCSEINLPSTLRKMDCAVFADLGKITEITIPENITMKSHTGDFCIRCYSLKKFTLLAPGVGIHTRAFENCNALETVILASDTQVSLAQTGSFKNTPIANGTGYIYVPSALVDSYKSATNWSTFASQIRAIEDYPEICGEVSA